MSYLPKAHAHYAAVAAAGLFGIILFPSLATADDVTKYRAVVEQFFLVERNAIPLFSNNTVFSGDVINLSTEETAVSRRECYDLEDPVYHRILREATDRTFELEASIGANIPFEKVGEVALEINGEAEHLASISFDPLSQEQPVRGTDELRKPKNKSECKIIDNIRAGLDGKHILVTRVFHGVSNIQTSIKVGGGVSGAAEITDERLKEVVKAILGDDPKIRAGISGSYATIEVATADQPMSLAVQSGVIDARQLGEMYIRFRQQQDAIKAALDKYYKEKDKGVLDKLRSEIEGLLTKADLLFRDVTQLYELVFAGKTAQPFEGPDAQKVPTEQWEALGAIAAANEITTKR